MFNVKVEMTEFLLYTHTYKYIYAYMYIHISIYLCFSVSICSLNIFHCSFNRKETTMLGKACKTAVEFPENVA